MSFFRSMNGTGGLSRRSSTSVISHSKSCPGYVDSVLTDTSDPFIHMIREKKTYGFTIAVKELKETVPNIFRYASAYKRMNNLTSKGL
jgi:hypothetical protein